MAEENKVQLKTITPEEASHIGPQEIVLNNAKILVHSELPKTKQFIETSLSYMKEQFDGTEDFRKDPKALVGVQLQLASLSLAVEYWLSKVKKSNIKICGADEMPKA